MVTPIGPVRVNHINMVLEDFDQSLAHMRDLFGADLLMDLPQREWHACVIDIGRALFEIFVPPTFLLNSRQGPHYLGIEYQADMGRVRAAMAEQGIRAARDIGVALHTHPADCLGVAFEFYDGHFHDNEAILGKPMRPAAWWRDAHPLGLTGLSAYTIAVHDLERGTRFLEDFLGAHLVKREARPQIGAQARIFVLSDCKIELMASSGNGWLEQHLRGTGEGICSTIFGVADPGAVKAHFAARGIALDAGTASGRLALSAAANLGVMFEFEG